jgi:hypothetical protein
MVQNRIPSLYNTKIAPIKKPTKIAIPKTRLDFFFSEYNFTAILFKKSSCFGYTDLSSKERNT